MTAQVLTANRLLDGEVVFLGARGWVETIDRATVAVTPEQAKALDALGRQAMAVNEVVDAYLIDVADEEGRLRPLKLREYLRTVGPSVRTDLGKQARPAGDRPCIAMTSSTGSSSLQRTAQFRDQVERRLAGELTEDQFKPLRLKNGLYLQLHAYMLRIAIPYGTLNSRQLRKLADIAENYDKGYGHFTTRQNLQFNWPKLKDAPDILDELAEVEMHAIQTSRQLHPQRHRRPLSPAPPPTRSTTRACGPSCCASGRRCTRSSATCRASSRSRSPARRPTARRCAPTTSA